MAWVSPAIRPMSTTITDEMLIEDALALLSSRLSRVKNIEAKVAKLAQILINSHSVCCIGVWRKKCFTLTQMSDILKDADLLETRETIEFVFGISFSNCSTPSDNHMDSATVSQPTNGLKVSRFINEGEMTLGNRLKAEGKLANIRLSPRLPDLIVNPHCLSPTDFWAVVNETVVFALVDFACVNVDVVYLDRVSGLLKIAYPNIPKDVEWNRALKNMFEKYRKQRAKVRTNFSRSRPGLLSPWLALPTALAFATGFFTASTIAGSRHTAATAATVTTASLSIAITAQAPPESIFSHLHPYRTPSQIFATVPLVDLKREAVILIREKGYPIDIDEMSPSLYNKYMEPPPGPSDEEAQYSWSHPTPAAAAAGMGAAAMGPAATGAAAMGAAAHQPPAAWHWSGAAAMGAAAMGDAAMGAAAATGPAATGAAAMGAAALPPAAWHWSGAAAMGAAAPPAPAGHWSPAGHPLGTVASSVNGFRQLTPKPPVNGGTVPAPLPPPPQQQQPQSRRARPPTQLKSPATGNGHGSKRGKHKSPATGNRQGSKRGKWKAAPLSKYELERNRTVEANNAVLKSLGLDKPILASKQRLGKKQKSNLVRARSDDDDSDYNDDSNDSAVSDDDSDYAVTGAVTGVTGSKKAHKKAATGSTGAKKARLDDKTGDGGRDGAAQTPLVVGSRVKGQARESLGVISKVRSLKALDDHVVSFGPLPMSASACL